MKRVLIWLYPLMDRFYHYWGYRRLALCGLIVICALLILASGLHLVHSSLQLSYSISQGSSDPIGGGH